MSHDPIYPSQIKTALEYYAAKLTDFETADTKASIQQALELLLAREKVEVLLVGNLDHVAESIEKLVHLDDRLRHQGNHIARLLPLSDYRDSIKSKPDAWWWFFEPDADPRDRYDWLWSALCVPFLTASGALLLDIGSRFLTGGVDTFGAFTVVTQSVLTLLTAGGALTKSGQVGIERALKSLNVPKHYAQEAKLVISLALLLGLVGARSSLPQVAQNYVQQGREAQLAGHFILAQNAYKRALQLDPTNKEAHYYLGTIYEDLQNFGEAESAYQFAAKSQFSPATSNLARLYILKNDSDEAVSLLLNHIDQVEEPKLRYFMLKNLGWARLQQKNYEEAETSLQEAIELYNSQPDMQPAIAHNRADPHCLLAQVLDVQKDPKANKEWLECLSYATSRIPEHDRWIHLAHQRLAPKPQL